MKLLAKYNRVNIIVTIIVLLLSSAVYYYFLNNALLHQLDNSLITEEQEINDFIQENHQLPDATVSKDEQEIYQLSDSIKARRFSSIELQSDPKCRKKYYRQLAFPVSANGRHYIAYVRKSQEETEDLVQLILKLTFAVVLILLVALFVINRLVLGKLWKPFNATLQQIKQFNVAAQQQVHLEPTGIAEFTELNTAVNSMMQKALQDYREIKSFTENASHEIQTPLAVIKSKVELLSQSDILQEQHAAILQSIAETTDRLSRLNQSLLLLTKIDNNQFTKQEAVNMSKLLHRHLDNYDELFQAKELSIVKKITGNLVLIMNETLAEILVTNLLLNAVKHNVLLGFIDIRLNEDELTISNSGAVLHTDPYFLFERFSKESANSDSLGLGLSIVKKISGIYGFFTSYHYADSRHTITVNFNKKH